MTLFPWPKSNHFWLLKCIFGWFEIYSLLSSSHSQPPETQMLPKLSRLSPWRSGAARPRLWSPGTGGGRWPSRRKCSPRPTYQWGWSTGWSPATRPAAGTRGSPPRCCTSSSARSWLSQGQSPQAEIRKMFSLGILFWEGCNLWQHKSTVLSILLRDIKYYWYNSADYRLWVGMIVSVSAPFWLQSLHLGRHWIDGAGSQTRPSSQYCRLIVFELLQNLTHHRSHLKTMNSE